jgi:hypothetical protein
MRVYTVHSLPGADAFDDPPVLVREGFSWPAALFSGFWALWHGMWLFALLLFAIVAGLEAGLHVLGADPVVRGAVAIGFFLIVGFCGHDWRRARLARRGYRFEGVIAATGFDLAQRRWFDLHPPGRTLSAPLA